MCFGKAILNKFSDSLLDNLYIVFLVLIFLGLVFGGILFKVGQTKQQNKMILFVIGVIGQSIQLAFVLGFLAGKFFRPVD